MGMVGQVKKLKAFLASSAYWESTISYLFLKKSVATKA
jgi:hypothetical protein